MKKLPVKLVCIDLDHTLLEFGEYEVDPLTVEAVSKTKATGKEVVVVTGRSLMHSLAAAKQLKLTYHVCFSGALVYDLIKDQPLSFRLFSFQAASFLEKILPLWKKQIFVIFYFLSEDEKKISSYFKGDYQSEAFEAFEDFKIELNPFKEIKSWKNLSQKKLLRVTVFGQPQTLDQLYPLLEKEKKFVNVIRNYPKVIEMMCANTEKSKGVEFLQKKLNFDWKETLVIGDSHNDLLLFEKAQYGIAVENAVPEIKKRAMAISTAFDKSGVRNALLKWVC